MSIMAKNGCYGKSDYTPSVAVTTVWVDHVIQTWATRTAKRDGDDGNAVFAKSITEW